MYRDITRQKVCVSCSEEKTIDSFHKKRDSSDGYQSKCMECTRKYNKSIYKNKTKIPASVEIIKRIFDRLRIPYSYKAIGTSYEKVDFVCYGCVKVEVKISTENSQGKHLWTFTKAQQNKGYCDIFIFIAVDRNNRKSYYVIPSQSDLVKNKSSLCVVFGSVHHNSKNGFDMMNYKNAFHIIRKILDEKIYSQEKIKEIEARYS